MVTDAPSPAIHRRTLPGVTSGKFQGEQFRKQTLEALIGNRTTTLIYASGKLAMVQFLRDNLEVLDHFIQQHTPLHAAAFRTAVSFFIPKNLHDSAFLPKLPFRYLTDQNGQHHEIGAAFDNRRQACTDSGII